MNMNTTKAAAIISLIAVTAVHASGSTDVAKVVAEGIELSARAKLAVSEAYLVTGKWPSNDEAAGYAPPSDVPFSISVGEGGTVEIIYSSPESIADRAVIYVPSPGDGVVHWSCQSRDVPGKYLPAVCK